MNDHALLREYAEAGSQTAFGQLVERHVALVYSAARRRLGDAQLAEGDLDLNPCPNPLRMRMT